ncbi:MAG TPA: 2-oxoglutarate and iron-dependent oxygenase domain-containing protein, partial [Cyclobacteriaceae bacterium]|nr:2-oxoglutarate and iron-dependent oxygenase domain-containing protein [Cyclobacteriaceae bacterium]
MSQILYDEIPSLDLNDFINGDDLRRDAFVRELGNAYNEIGFVAVKNHFLTDELTAKLYAVVKAFFDLPDEVKQQYEIPDLAGQRGYIGKGKEHAKGRNTGDLKEFYHIGQVVEGDDPIGKEYPKNIWPSEIPDFERV